MAIFWHFIDFSVSCRFFAILEAATYERVAIFVSLSTFNHFARSSLVFFTGEKLSIFGFSNFSRLWQFRRVLFEVLAIFNQLKQCWFSNFSLFCRLFRRYYFLGYSDFFIILKDPFFLNCTIKIVQFLCLLCFLSAIHYIKRSLFWYSVDFLTFYIFVGLSPV